MIVRRTSFCFMPGLFLSILVPLLLPSFVSLSYLILLGRVDNFSLFDCFCPFCFLLIEFHLIYCISYVTYYHIVFIIIVFRLGSDKLG